MNLIACYGSLKKGHYNHSVLGADAEYMGNSSVRGVMYSNGSYPKLYLSTPFLEEEVGHEPAHPLHVTKEREHILEVYRINPKAFERINSMELGAGYSEEHVETEWGPATIWYMPHEHFSSSDKWVESY